MNKQEFEAKYRYSEATPVMQQYLNIKYDNFDALLLFRMGDFYELFFEDAITASRALGIALTKRGKNTNFEVEMCGVPFHALEGYLNKLLLEGYKVAICDQQETPEQAKKKRGYKAVVRRAVSRIITPGTVVEDSLIEGEVPKYLASIAISNNGKEAAICYTDLASGKINLLKLPARQITNEIGRIKPAELLLADKLRGSELASIIGRFTGVYLSYQVNSIFAESKCQSLILSYYNIKDISAIGQLSHEMIAALGSTISYINLTQKASAPKLPMPLIELQDKIMQIDAATRKNLELNQSLSGNNNGSLFHNLNHCKTKAGSRLLYTSLNSPLLELSAIEKRLDYTEYFWQQEELRQGVREYLSKIGDLERCVTRINMGRSTPRDLLSIKEIIKTSHNIRALFTKGTEGENRQEVLPELIDALLGAGEVFELIDISIREDAPISIKDGGIIKSSYDAKVAELDLLINNSKGAVSDLRDKYRSQTGVDNLKISTNNVLGMFIEVSSKQASKIDTNIFDHRQSTVSAARFSCPELKELETKIVHAHEHACSLQYELYQDICSKIMLHNNALLAMANSLSQLDFYCSLAHIANERGYCRPEMDNSLTLDIVAGRHPIVESALNKEGGDFMPNDLGLNMDERIWLISGPNMAGKSTFLRQNALITIMAHMGSFVPATKAKIGIVDKIFSRIGSGDDLSKGQSTFMVEMLEASNIIAQGTHRSLLILDEVGRGTATFDGLSIAWALLEHIHDKMRSRCLFASHYHELAELEGALMALKTYNVAVKEGDGELLFLHKITSGSASRSYGVHVAALAGLPQPLIRRANQLLDKFERNGKTRQKEALASTSNNHSFFDITQATKDEPKDNMIANELETIDPDSLTPKEALEHLYALKELLVKL